MARSLQFRNDQGKANFDEKMAPPDHEAARVSGPSQHLARER
jgi:hypothetical protein